jgi:hypothetical protein
MYETGNELIIIYFLGRPAFMKVKLIFFNFIFLFIYLLLLLLFTIIFIIFKKELHNTGR